MQFCYSAYARKSCASVGNARNAELLFEWYGVYGVLYGADLLCMDMLCNASDHRDAEVLVEGDSIHCNWVTVAIAMRPCMLGMNVEQDCASLALSNAT